MPIASVSIPVPLSGDGPAVSVASLIEAKTVILSGLFRGSYAILANHVGGAFAPVLLFNSDGTEEIRQTLSGAFSEIKVRANGGVAQVTPITVTVAALQKAGANLFTTLATLLPGAAGLSPVVDLAALFPPTGLENDINVICMGGFEGTITLLGSNDGFSFNPIGTFSASPAQKNFFGLAQILEFSPLFTTDLVRYLRLDVQGKVLSPTTITIGGAIFNTVVNTDTLSGAYNNGSLASDQTLSLTDTHGGGVVILGSGLMFTGANSLAIQSPLGGQVLFPRVGGLSVVSQIQTPAAGATWNELDLKSSTLVLTGPPAILSSLAMVHVGQGIINGIGSTVADAYDLKIDAAPAGLVGITRSWSLGTAGAVQVSQNGLVLGSALSPPGENDLALGAGATIVSEANSGRLGYELAGQRFMVSANGGAYVPLATGPASGFTQGSVVFVGVSGGLDEDNADFFWDNTGKRLGVNVAAAPTAMIHVTGSAAGAPGTGSLKLDPGVLLLAPESGVIESDGTHLYWTDGTGTRVELDNGAVATTLADAYANGTVSADQTFVLLDAEGGGLVVNATTPVLFTGVTAFEIDVIGGGVNFYRAGGFDVQSTMSKAAAAGTTWNEVSFLGSTLALTGGPAVVTAVSQVRVGAAVVNGPGNTVSDAYNLLIEAGPAGTATLTRAWSLGTAGAVQVGSGVVLGVGLLPPTENDLVVGAGATIVSEANTGRLGYLAGGTQAFMVSVNGGAYVPLLTGPGAGGFTPGSVPFGSATGALAQDNAQLFWDDTNKYLGVGTNAVGSRLVVAGGTYTDAGGIRDNVAVTGTFAPVGGTAAYDQMNLAYVVDQTGGANGRVVGLLIAATETAVGGLHYPIDVFAGAGGVTELFRVVNDGAVQTKKGLTLGLGLAAPGESDLAIENGATVLSQANTGRLGYRTSTQQFYVSMNGGAYVPIATGASSVTLAQAYGFGTVAADQTLALLDAKGGQFVVDGSAAGFTTLVSMQIKGDYLQTGLARLALTVGTEVVGANFNFSATKQWATGALATQREVVFQAPTYGFVGASTITNAATVAITNAPQLGANAAITNAYALWTQAGATQLDGGSYAPTSGTKTQLGVTAIFAPTSGGAAFQALNLAYTINQTGGAGGMVTGLLLNAAETAVVGTHNLLNLQVGGVSRVVIDRYGSSSIIQAVAGTAGNLNPILSVSGGNLTGLTAGVEHNSVLFNCSATKDWAAGAIATQREVVFQAPTYAFDGASTITTAATVAITGAPIAGTNATITNPLALWTQSGTVQFDGGSYAPTAGAKKQLSITAAFAPTSGTATFAAASIAYTTNQTGGANGTVTGLLIRETPTATVSGGNLLDVGSAAALQNSLLFQRNTTIAGGGLGLGLISTPRSILHVTENALLTTGGDNFSRTVVVEGTNAPTSSSAASPRCNVQVVTTDPGSVNLGGSLGFGGKLDSGSSFYIFGTLAGRKENSNTSDISGYLSFATRINAGLVERLRISSLGNFTFQQGISDSTIPTLLTITGAAHTNITASSEDIGANFNFSATKQWATGAIATQREIIFQAPTYGFVGASTITTGATVAITGAPIAGTNATITRSYALWIQAGGVRFDGGQTVHGTDVNVAGPYTILATDYYLHVRRTATAAISLNLPSIAVVGDGFVIMAKDSGYNAAINNITWVRNGADTIENVAGNYIQNVTASLIAFVANATTNNWELA